MEGNVTSFSNENSLIIGKKINYDFGHLHSVLRKKPILSKNKIVPWYTYSAIEYLDKLDFSKLDIFEYGSGIGSIYWATKCKKIISVELNTKWYAKIKKNKLKNQKIILRKSKLGYINSIFESKIKFDVVIIDGSFRFDCVNVAVSQLKNSGLIILDNSDWYKNTAIRLRDLGFAQIDFSGFGPINYYAWQTSLFIKDIRYLKMYNCKPVVIGGQKIDPEDDK